MTSSTRVRVSRFLAWFIVAPLAAGTVGGILFLIGVVFINAWNNR